VDIPAGPVDAASPAINKGKLNIDTIEVRVEPRAEWAQIFDEAWRINRDYFYAPNYHGADWSAKAKYQPFLPALLPPDSGQASRRSLCRGDP
jgi:tricorn protease